MGGSVDRRRGTPLAFVGMGGLVMRMRGTVSSRRGSGRLAGLAFNAWRRSASAVGGRVCISVGGGLTLACLLELDGAFSVDRTRLAYPAIPFVWNLVLDDAKAGGMAPASARVAADGEAVVVGEATDAGDGFRVLRVLAVARGGRVRSRRRLLALGWDGGGGG